MTGLDNGTAYTFRLRAVNEAGAGAASAETSAVPTAPPDRPTGLVITPGDALLHLAWDDPGDATIIGWQMRAAARHSALSSTAWRNVAGSDAETTRATITGLVNGTDYYVELRAVNPSGAGPQASLRDEQDRPVAVAPVSVPAKPTGLDAAAEGTFILLTWDDPQDATVTGWQVQYQDNISEIISPWEDLLLIELLDGKAGELAARVTGLRDNPHSFSIRAVNASGAGPQSDVALGTPDLAADRLPDPAPAPENLAAASLDGGLRIGWSDPEDATIGGWYLRHRTGSGSFGAWAELASVAADPADASRLIFDTTDESGVALANGTAHTVEIRATRTKYYDDDNQLQPMPETKLVNGLKVVRSRSWASPAR